MPAIDVYHCAQVQQTGVAANLPQDARLIGAHTLMHILGIPLPDDSTISFLLYFGLQFASCTGLSTVTTCILSSIHYREKTYGVGVAHW